MREADIIFFAWVGTVRFKSRSDRGVGFLFIYQLIWSSNRLWLGHLRRFKGINTIRPVDTDESLEQQVGAMKTVLTSVIVAVLVSLALLTGVKGKPPLELGNTDVNTDLCEQLRRRRRWSATTAVGPSIATVRENSTWRTSTRSSALTLSSPLPAWMNGQIVSFHWTRTTICTTTGAAVPTNVSSIWNGSIPRWRWSSPSAAGMKVPKNTRP